MNFRIPSLFTHTMLSSLDTHIRATHKGMKYPVGQCEHKVTSKSSLERHRSSVHVLLRYPCEQCEYQASIKLQKSELLYLGLSVGLSKFFKSVDVHVHKLTIIVTIYLID